MWGVWGNEFLELGGGPKTVYEGDFQRRQRSVFLSWVLWFSAFSREETMYSLLMAWFPSYSSAEVTWWTVNLLTLSFGAPFRRRFVFFSLSTILLGRPFPTMRTCFPLRHFLPQDSHHSGSLSPLRLSSLGRQALSSLVSRVCCPSIKISSIFKLN